MSNKIRLRFAPSPTGPLHIGGLRTALYNYLIAKNLNGTFILRIEDTDLSRFNKKAEDHIIDSLNWCGLEPDESPQKPGKFGPYRQSERKIIYKEHVDLLLKKGRAYYAFDTKDELDCLREEFEKRGETFIYNWKNRNRLKNTISLNKEQSSSFIEKGDYVIRYKMYDSKDKKDNILIKDEIRGNISVDKKILDDKIIFKKDGMPTYHLANVVDDHLMKITHVVRGEEWLPSLALHSSLYRSFEWNKPIFAHLPLILKPTGKGKLSKRDGKKFGIPVYPIAWVDKEDNFNGFREIGFQKEALINFLSLIGWNPGDEKEIFSIKELINKFSLDRIIKSGAKYDYDKAIWFNQEHIKNINSEKIRDNLHDKIISKYNNQINENKVLELIELVKDRVNFKKDIYNECVSALEFNGKSFKENHSIISKEFGLKSVILELKNEIEKSNKKEVDDIKEVYFSKLKDNNIKIGSGMRGLRISITGKTSGPNLFKIATILKKDEIIKRIEHSLISLDD